MKFFKTTKYNKGFTVIEILIAIGIFVLIIGAVTLFARNTFYYKNIFFSGLKSSDDANHILQPIASEIRSASLSSLGSYPLETVGDNTLVFYSDIDDDGLKERVRYFLNGNVFSKGIISPSGSPLVYVINSEVVTPLIGDIANGVNPIFSYFDTNYNGTTAPLSQPVSVQAIRLIKIDLMIDANGSLPPVPYTVTTQISIRNLKDNL